MDLRNFNGQSNIANEFQFQFQFELMLQHSDNSNRFVVFDQSIHIETVFCIYSGYNFEIGTEAEMLPDC